MAIAVAIAPLMGIDKKGGFQYIQEYTGFVSPGIFAMFLLGFFWRRTNGAAAMFAAIASVGLSIVLKFLPDFVDLSFLAPIGFAANNGAGVYEIPFLDRTLIVFLLIVIGMAIISLLGRQPASTIVKVDRSMFKVEPGFAFGSAVVCAILVIVYAAWW